MLEEILGNLSLTGVYLTLFFLFLLEGPVVNFVASAMAATTEFLNIWLILFLAILGDVIGDTVYFFIGKRIRLNIITSKVRLIVNEEMIGKAKKQLDSNLFGFMFLIKLFSITAVPGILYLGHKGTSLKEFILNTIILAVFFNGLISFLAYNLVIGLSTFLSYQNKINLAGAIILAGLFLFFITKIMIIRILRRKTFKLNYS